MTTHGRYFLARPCPRAGCLYMIVEELDVEYPDEDGWYGDWG